MANLTTLTRFKAYSGITGQDALVTALLPMVSNQVEKFLRRTLALTTYRSWVDGLGSPIIRLPQWPVLAVYQVSVLPATVARIYRADDSASRATVSFDGTNVILTEVSDAGTETITELAVATYKIMSTLETAVEAVSGWSMELSSSSYGVEPAAQLRPILAQDALYPSSADLQVPDDPDPVKLVGDDIIELTSGGNFSKGTGNVFVWYKAGYSLPADTGTWTMPPGLELVVQQILVDVIGSIDTNANFASESIGDHSWSLRTGQGGSALASAIQNRKKDLAAYRKVTV